MKKSFLKGLAVGAAAGVISGLFGGGGGMVVVPMLENVLRLDEKRSHATAILIILPVTVAALIAYLTHVEYPFSIGLPVAVGGVVGGALGSVALKKINSKILSTAFYLLTLFVGVKYLFFN